MHHTLWNILLWIVATCTMISYLPQAKKSRDLSIQSRILWVVSSLSYTLYAVLCSHDFMLILETSLEFVFCLIILSLAIKYRK